MVFQLCKRHWRSWGQRKMSPREMESLVPCHIPSERRSSDQHASASIEPVFTLDVTNTLAVSSSDIVGHLVLFHKGCFVWVPNKWLLIYFYCLISSSVVGRYTKVKLQGQDKTWESPAFMRLVFFVFHTVRINQSLSKGKCITAFVLTFFLIFKWLVKEDSDMVLHISS